MRLAIVLGICAPLIYIHLIIARCPLTAAFHFTSFCQTTRAYADMIDIQSILSDVGDTCIPSDNNHEIYRPYTRAQDLSLCLHSIRSMYRYNKRQDRQINFVPGVFESVIGNRIGKKSWDTSWMNSSSKILSVDQRVDELLSN